MQPPYKLPTAGGEAHKIDGPLWSSGVTLGESSSSSRVLVSVVWINGNKKTVVVNGLNPASVIELWLGIDVAMSWG